MSFILTEVAELLDALRTGGGRVARLEQARGAARGVALQVAFERQTLKPVFSLEVIGYGFERL